MVFIIYCYVIILLLKVEDASIHLAEALVKVNHTVPQLQILSIQKSTFKRYHIYI